jgi:hypothetical protein
LNAREWESPPWFFALPSARQGSGLQVKFERPVSRRGLVCRFQPPLAIVGGFFRGLNNEVGEDWAHESATGVRSIRLNHTRSNATSAIMEGTRDGYSRYVMSPRHMPLVVLKHEDFYRQNSR